MWIILRDLDETAEAYFAAIGRALAIAQHFESTCKYIVTMIEGSMGLEAGGLQTLDDFIGFVKSLDGRMLGATIKRAESMAFRKADEVTTLVQARDARNYIAHDAALSGMYPSVKYGERLTAAHYLPRLRSEVAALVRGDNLVSIWQYEFQEREPAPYGLRATYPEEVLAWVLKPLDGFALRPAAD